MKLSGVKDEEIDVVTNSICTPNKAKGILVETSPAYKEMERNGLLAVSCWYAGAGDQFTVNQESATELVIKHVAVDEEDTLSPDDYNVEIIKRIEIPKGTEIKIGETIGESSPVPKEGI